MAVDFGKARKEAEAAGLLGSGDYLKLKEGDNRLRLMTECLPHPGEYKGTRNFKWLCYVIDRKDGKIKPFFMPHTIYKRLEALQLSEDYAFTDVPMPYDVTIHAAGAGTKEVEYSLMPARKETSISAIEHQEFAKLKPLAELQRTLKKEKNAQQPPTPSGYDDMARIDENDDSIPF